MNRFPLRFVGGYAKHSLRQNPEWPTSVPWAFVDVMRGRIEDDHGESLEAIAASGGISPAAMVAAAAGVPPAARSGMTIWEAMDQLGQLLASWHADQETAMEAEAAAKAAATEPEPQD